MFHMPLFTFVSGYFCQKSHRTTQEKVVGILKIYVGVQVFYFLLDKYFFGKTDINLELFSPAWTTWYLLSLIFWYIIADFIKDKKKWFIFSILVALYIGFDHSVGGYVSISRTFFFLPHFIAGLSFKREYIEKIKSRKKELILLSSVILFILYLIKDKTPLDLLFEYSRYTAYFDSAAFPMFLRSFHYVGSFILGLCILAFIPFKKTIINTIGKNSLIMYITHSGVTKVLYRFSFQRYTTPFYVFRSELLILATTIAITLGYSYMKNYYYNKKNQKIEITSDIAQ